MWQYIALWVVTAIISYALRPKPPESKPPGFNEESINTAEEGRVIGVLFGTRDIPGGNSTWYGDIRLVAIKKKGGKK